MILPCYKKKYSRKIDAEMALVVCRAHHAPRRRECRFYFCWICYAYHLTSQSSKLSVIHSGCKIEG